jgi:hypothetical protein
MVGHMALSSRSAVTRVSALFILTGQIVGALVVTGTFRSGATDHGITAVAVYTVASGVVVVIGLAIGICAALSVPAWVDTVSIYAGFGGRTIGIGPTSDLVTSTLGITRESFATGANRSVQLHATFGILGANSISGGAWVDTLLVHAGLVVGTLGVGRAFWLWNWVHLWRTLDKRRSNIAVGTRTNGLVIDHTTDGVQAASADARVATFLVVASAIGRAVRVDHTFGVLATGHTVDDTAYAVTSAW